MIFYHPTLVKYNACFTYKLHKVSQISPSCVTSLTNVPLLLKIETCLLGVKMELLSGKNLMRFDGSSVSSADALANKKLVAFYFSAHWCPPCKAFTPVLKKFYEVIQWCICSGIKLVFYYPSSLQNCSYFGAACLRWLEASFRGRF